MRNYEIMFIVKPTLEEEEIKKVAASFQNGLEKNGAKVTNVDAWGKRGLAYEIKKGNETFRSGYYYVINLESENDLAVKEFDRLALINANVIRHLVIRKED